MRRRLTLWMIALFVPLLAALSWWMGEHSFALSMRREQESAQLTQSMIVAEVRQAVAGLSYETLCEAARQYRQTYAAQGLELIFCYGGTPIGGGQLPSRLYDGLLGGGRRALLDTQTTPQRYTVAEPISDRVTLLVLRDVSGLYAMRAGLRRAYALCAALGALAACVLSGWLAGRFTRPIAQLSQAALALARQEPPPTALPTAGKDELGALARSFETMQRAVATREEALRRESAERQSMLDALAHEMRTPLCALLGNARLLQQPLPEGERAAVAEGMVREIKRLSDLDAQLMKLTRLRAEPIEREAVAVLPLLCDTASRLRPQAGQVELAVAGDEATLTGDRALLSLMADNLAVNALRASAPGQTVTLTALPNGFGVQDHGIGMTREQMEHIFEPFYKADKARTRSLGGAGLGLTLCRRVADLHDGRLEVESAPGKGTLVTFTTSLQPVADSVTPQAVSYGQEVSHP